MARFGCQRLVCAGVPVHMDPTEDQARAGAAFRSPQGWLGGRYFEKPICEGVARYSIGTVKPSLQVLRKRWNFTVEPVSRRDRERCGSPKCSRLAAGIGTGAVVHTGTGRTPDR